MSFASECLPTCWHLALTVAPGCNECSGGSPFGVQRSTGEAALSSARSALGKRMPWIADQVHARAFTPRMLPAKLGPHESSRQVIKGSRSFNWSCVSSSKQATPKYEARSDRGCRPFENPYKEWAAVHGLHGTGGDDVYPNFRPREAQYGILDHKKYALEKPRR